MDVGLFGFSHTTLPFPIHLCSSCVGAHRLGPIPFQLLAKADREPRPTPEKGTPHSHVKPGKSPLTLGLIGPGALSSFGFSPSSAKLHAPHQQDPAPCDNFSLSHGPSPVALHPLLFPGGEDASPETLPACRQCGGGLPCLQARGGRALPRLCSPHCFASGAMQRLKVFVPLLRAQEVHGAKSGLGWEPNNWTALFPARLQPDADGDRHSNRSSFTIVCSQPGSVQVRGLRLGAPVAVSTTRKAGEPDGG